MENKGRRPWKRGAKERYSVYKAEDNIDGEQDFKGWAESIAKSKGIDLTQFYQAEAKHPWMETYLKIASYVKKNGL